MAASLYFMLAIIFWAAGGLYLILMAFFFNKINLVIGIMGAALKVTLKSSEIKFVPVFGGFAITIFCVFNLWILVAATSIGEVNTIEAQNIDGGKVKIMVYEIFNMLIVPIDYFLSYYLISF